MILAIAGTCVLLGLITFLEWKGKRRPLWHWIALVIAVLALIALVTLWVGEYRFENQRSP
jgi:heme/copper-type cytochrome/quinol oxidase subunit 4